MVSFGQCVVKVAENFDGLNVDRVFFAGTVLFVTGDEGELLNVFVEFGQGKLGLAVVAGFE